MTKIALVTGGTRGIGEAISKKLKNDGHTVVVNYGNNEEAAKEFSEQNNVTDCTYTFCFRSISFS